MDSIQHQNHPVSSEYLHPWTTFNEDIQSTLQSLDLSKPAGKADSSEGEKYLIRNQRGLATRFVHYVCDPVAKALSTTFYQYLVFENVEGVQSSDDSFLGLINQRPETEGNGYDHNTPVAAGDVKRFWISKLEKYPVMGRSIGLSSEYPIGM